MPNARVQAWWQARTRRDKVHVLILVALVAVAVYHQFQLWNWYIEDAAISFSYARNLADGEGLVTSVGHERVEGYSNPAWVFLLALFEWFGIEGFQSSKVLQLILAGWTVPMVYAITRRIAGRESEVPLLAAGTLALNTQFAIWGASGLENALFNALLATGVWRLLCELDEPGFPGSALLFAVLAVTRPEAPMYALVAAAFITIFHLWRGHGLRPVWVWWGSLVLPLAVYHLGRFWYFAWELPSTFYAKIGEHRPPKPWDFRDRGWKYVRNWSAMVGQAWLVPVYLVAAMGPGRWRPFLALTLATAVAMVICLPGDQRWLLLVVLLYTLVAYQTLLFTQPEGRRPRMTLVGVGLVAAFLTASEVMRFQGYQTQVQAPSSLEDYGAIWMIAVGVVAGLVGLTNPRQHGRALCWALFCGGLLYAISAHGDWMTGWRWMSLIAVPGSVLVALGVGDLARLVQQAFTERPGWHPATFALSVVPLVALAVPNWQYTQVFRDRPETGPFAVKQRVEFKSRVKQTLHLDERLVDLDVDMGAHMWWAKDAIYVDIAGLVDVPMAQHKFDHAFIDEYVFEERKPHFAHVHGGWATNSRIPTHSAWSRDYVEIPGYPANAEQFHIGNFIRRDLLLKPAWPHGSKRRVPFEGQYVLEGWRIPSPQAAPDRRFYIEIALRNSRRRTADKNARLLLFLANQQGQVVATYDLPLGYDWLPPHRWNTHETFVGKYSPTLPADMPLGAYDVGFVLVGGNGAVLEAAPTGEDRAGLSGAVMVGGEGPWPARMSAGEVRFSRGLEVVSVDAMEAQSETTAQQAVTTAAAGECEAAEDLWFQARMHRPRALPWFEKRGPEVKRALAECWATAAEGDTSTQVQHLSRAHDWDHHSPTLERVGAPVADALYADGQAAFDEGDWDSAYALFGQILTFQPHHAWARRMTEKARVQRLDIDPGAKARRKAEYDRKRRELRQRQEAYERENR